MYACEYAASQPGTLQLYGCSPMVTERVHIGRVDLGGAYTKRQTSDGDRRALGLTRLLTGVCAEVDSKTILSGGCVRALPPGAPEGVRREVGRNEMRL